MPLRVLGGYAAASMAGSCTGHAVAAVYLKEPVTVLQPKVTSAVLLETFIVIQEESNCVLVSFCDLGFWVDFWTFYKQVYSHDIRPSTSCPINSMLMADKMHELLELLCYLAFRKLQMDN